MAESGVFYMAEIAAFLLTVHTGFMVYDTNDIKSGKIGIKRNPNKGRNLIELSNLNFDKYSYSSISRLGNLYVGGWLRDNFEPTLLDLVNGVKYLEKAVELAKEINPVLAEAEKKQLDLQKQRISEFKEKKRKKDEEESKRKVEKSREVEKKRKEEEAKKRSEGARKSMTTNIVGKWNYKVELMGRMAVNMTYEFFNNGTYTYYNAVTGHDARGEYEVSGNTIRYLTMGTQDTFSLEGDILFLTTGGQSGTFKRVR